MREIKFRAWYHNSENIKIGEMSYSFYHIKDKDCCLNNEIFEIDNTIVSMQFTGLHDKNGKDIYEGDIVKINKKNYKMIFENGCFQLEYYNNGDYYSGDDPLCTEYNESEVVGNIYENPELLP